VESNVNGNDLIDIDLSGYTILIADDEESNYILTKRMLHETKVKTDWAKNGKKAVELAAQKKIDLILMDIKMPDIDGIEATRQIKLANNKIPIIMQTAFAMPHIKDEAIEAGCNDFIVKPLTTNNLMELIIKQLANKMH
jgi:CheY-like chemotaxis protein